MTKLNETLQRLNSLHQQPEIPGDNRPRISLAHIDVQGGLRAHRERFAKSQQKARAANEAAANGFSIGQLVAMKNNRNKVGPIVSIDSTRISVEIGGKISVFAASMLVAA